MFELRLLVSTTKLNSINVVKCRASARFRRGFHLPLDRTGAMGVNLSNTAIRSLSPSSCPSWFYMRDHLCRSGVYARRGQEPIVRRESTLARKTGHGERVKKSPGPDTSSKRVEGRPARETAFTFVNKKQCSGTGVPPVVGL